MEPTNTIPTCISAHDSMGGMMNGDTNDQKQHVEFDVVDEWDDCDCYKLDSNSTLPTVESSFEDDEIDDDDEDDDDMTYDRERYHHDDDENDDATETSQQEDEDIPSCDNDDDDDDGSWLNGTDGISAGQRRIRFNMSRNQVHEVLNIDSYTAKESKRCWFTKEETQKMKIRREKIVARMDAGRPSKGLFCYRGLEHMTIKGSQRLDTLVDTLINKVIDEQDRQWDLDQINQSMEATINGESRIASISQNLSAICQIEARTRARQDEVEATSIHFEHLMSTLSSDEDNEDDDSFNATRSRRGSTSGLDSSTEEMPQEKKTKKKNSGIKSKNNKTNTKGKNNRRITKANKKVQQASPSPPSPGERFNRGTLQIQRSSLSQLFSKKYMPVA